MTMPDRIAHFIYLNSPYYCRHMRTWTFVAAVLWRMTWIPLDRIIGVVNGLGEVLPPDDVLLGAGVIFGRPAASA